MRVLALSILAALGCACGDDAAAVDAAPDDPDRGSFRVSWTVVDGGESISCGDVGAITVVVRAQPVAGATGEALAFSCTSGEATSSPLPIGSYDAEIDLVGPGNRSLLAEPIVREDVVIAAGETVDLGAVDFEVPRVGALRFAIDAAGTGSNCGTGADDANLIGMRLELRDDDGDCVPATFAVGDGGGASGSYETTCPAGPAFGCIEADQEIALDPAPSGAHELAIVGLQGGDLVDNECQSRVSQFTIPGGGLDADLESIALALEYKLGCDPDFEAPDGGVSDAGPSDAGAADAMP